MTPLAPRIAVRAARARLPAGLVAALDTHLRAHAAGDRIDEVLDELERVRAETGWPPLAAPIGQILASQALVHVLSANRYQTVVDELRDLLDGPLRQPPGADRPDRAAGRRAARRRGGRGEASARPRGARARTPQARRERGGAAAARALRRRGRGAAPHDPRACGGEETLLGGALDQTRAERIREVVRIVQETGVDEITVEEGGMRVSVRRTDDESARAAAPAAGRSGSRRARRTPSSR